MSAASRSHNPSDAPAALFEAVPVERIWPEVANCQHLPQETGSMRINDWEDGRRQAPGAALGSSSRTWAKTESDGPAPESTPRPPETDRRGRSPLTAPRADERPLPRCRRAAITMGRRTRGGKRLPWYIPRAGGVIAFAARLAETGSDRADVALDLRHRDLCREPADVGDPSPDAGDRRAPGLAALARRGGQGGGGAHEARAGRSSGSLPGRPRGEFEPRERAGIDRAGIRLTKKNGRA